MQTAAGIQKWWDSTPQRDRWAKFLTVGYIFRGSACYLTVAVTYCKNIGILSASLIILLRLKNEHRAFGDVDLNWNEMPNCRNSVPDVVGTRRRYTAPTPHTLTSVQVGLIVPIHFLSYRWNEHIKSPHRPTISYTGSLYEECKLVHFSSTFSPYSIEVLGWRKNSAFYIGE